jgi:hypothetical protein
VVQRDEQGNVTVHAAPAAAVASFPAPKLTMTMPLEWVARGYVLAVRRFDAAAAASQSNARDVCISLHEAATWMDSLKEARACGELQADARVKGFTCARNRTHHGFAAAVYFDAGRRDWFWQPLDVLPEPTDPKHLNPKLCRCYAAHLERRPVGEVLAFVERAVLQAVPGLESA